MAARLKRLLERLNKMAELSIAIIIKFIFIGACAVLFFVAAIYALAYWVMSCMKNIGGGHG